MAVSRPAAQAERTLVTTVHPFKVIGCYDGFMAINGMAWAMGLTREDAIQKCNEQARAIERSILGPDEVSNVTRGLSQWAVKKEVGP